jgi:sigma-B regulation protein RsbU (phosphoserine phosphatase)
VQQHLLPQEFPAIEGVEVAAYYEASLTIGGDYYDVIAVGPRRWGFAIADVSGKGTCGRVDDGVLPRHPARHGGG